VTIVATIVLERRRIGTSAESGQYNDHSCRAYLQKGRVACNAALLNKEKLETAMLDQIREQILRKNVRRYLELVPQQARQSHVNPSGTSEQEK
jgi:hypothetical protein